MQKDPQPTHSAPLHAQLVSILDCCCYKEAQRLYRNPLPQPNGSVVTQRLCHYNGSVVTQRYMVKHNGSIVAQRLHSTRHQLHSTPRAAYFNVFIVYQCCKEAQRLYRNPLYTITQRLYRKVATRLTTDDVCPLTGRGKRDRERQPDGSIISQRLYRIAQDPC